MSTDVNDAILCDLSAIPADQRESHIALGKSLLANDVVAEHDEDVRLTIGAGRLGDVVRFIENERLCCGHLSFALEVPARGADLAFRISGPGVRAEFRAILSR